MPLRNRKLKLADSSVTATVGIGRRQDSRFGLEVALSVTLDGVERAEAESLTRAAREGICLVLVPGDAVDACCGEVKLESGPKRVFVSASTTRAQA